MYGSSSRLLLLPAGLIALLLSSPVLTAESQPQPTSPADPFYHIAKSVKRETELPVCCLRPVQTDDPLPAVEEEILPFEEWKSRQEHLRQQQQGKKDGDASTKAKTDSRSSSSETQREHKHGTSSVATDGQPPPLEPPAPAPPHFRVPLTDRFNYASLDCSARVHNAHRSARSPSNLLSSKKDKYMLSPCTTPDGEGKFVVVELCDDIRIDTVQLANFEFFSGVFKEFSVSVARTSPTDPDGWTPAGTYRAKNIRGIQSFHPPTSLRDFYRFIRIDFHSHYGNEYYCPVSLLRVYGLTHLEQWKWDVWEAEYEAKNEAAVRSISSTSAGTPPDSSQAVRNSQENEEVRSAEEPHSKGDDRASEVSEAVASSSKVVDSISTGATAADTSSEAISSSPDSADGSHKLPPYETTQASSVSPVVDNTVSVETLASSSLGAPIQALPSTSSASDPLAQNGSSIAQQNYTSSSSLAEPARRAERTTTPVSSTPMPTIVAHESRAIPAVASTGESIYRTIMTRLSALEANSTLYLRYIEEQTRSLRDALTRLEEDIGRLEGLSRATTQSFQKIINEMDRQRRRLEREHGELQTRVDYLTDEVVLEKQLGIAQLCLLLVVLVFMALTRGSRGEPFISEVPSGRRRDALREWGRRQLSTFSSGEWASSKLRAESPRREVESFVKSPIPIRKADKVKIPIQETRSDGDQTPRDSSGSLAMPLSSKGKTLAEIRAPHPRHFVSHRPRTPTSAGFVIYPPSVRSAGLLSVSSSSHGAGSGGRTRPRMRRASSHGTPVPMPMTYSQSAREGVSPLPGSTGTHGPVSVRKWAKTAHLHEIRKKSPKLGGGNDGCGNENLRSGVGSGGGRRKDQRSNQENVNGRREDEELKRFSSDVPSDSDDRDRGSGLCVPLSVSRLQNRTRRQAQTCLPADNPQRGDVDVESENWVDTDMDGSDIDTEW